MAYNPNIPYYPRHSVPGISTGGQGLMAFTPNVPRMSNFRQTSPIYSINDPGQEFLPFSPNVPGMINVRQGGNGMMFYSQATPRMVPPPQADQGMMFYPQAAPGMVPPLHAEQEMMFYPQAAPGMVPPSQSSQPMINYSGQAETTASLFSGTFSNVSSQSSGIYTSLGSIKLGVPTEVLHTEGNPLSMQLQLCNEYLINTIQSKLSAVSQNPNFNSIYAFSRTPKIGDLCCAKWSTDNVFYRARVEEVDPLIVRFVDFGNMDIVDENQIFRLEDSLRDVPFQAVHCKLRGLESLVTNPSSVVIDGEQREHLQRILQSGKLYAVFYKPDLRSPTDPPFEVDLISHIDVAKYIVSNQLIGDVEKVKKEYEAETKFFLPADENVGKSLVKIKSEPLTSPSRTLPAQTKAEGGVGTDVNPWTRTPAPSNHFKENQSDDSLVVSRHFIGPYHSAVPNLLSNQFENDPLKLVGHHSTSEVEQQDFDECIELPRPEVMITSKRNVERWLTGEAVRESDLDPRNLPPWEQPPSVEEENESPKLVRKKYPYIANTPDSDRETISRRLTYEDSEEILRRSMSAGRAKCLGLKRKEELSNELRVGLGRAGHREQRKLRELTQASAHKDATGYSTTENRFGARGPRVSIQEPPREIFSKSGSEASEARASKSDHRQKSLTDTNSQAQFSKDVSEVARSEDLSPEITTIFKEDKTSRGEEDDHFNSTLPYIMPTPINSNVIEYYLLQSGPLKPDLFYIHPSDEAANEFIVELAVLSDQFAEHFEGRPAPQNWSTEVKSLSVGTYLAVDCKDESWQRGELVRVFEDGNATKVEAFMIDFGDTKVVDIDNVRRLPKKFGRLPKMALPCKLQRILPLNGSSTFSDEAIDEFVNTLKTVQHELLCDDFSKIPLEVQVEFILPTGELVILNSYLIELGLASFDKSPVKDNDDHANDAQRLMDAWNPCEDDYNSIQNNRYFRSDDVEMVKDGIRSSHPSRNICKFYRANGKCSRGKDCKFLHVQASSLDFQGEGPVIVINHEVELPTVGSKVYVEVTVIRHPNSFSVNLPYGNVDMAKVEDFRELEAQITAKAKGDLFALTKDMTKFYSRHKQHDFKTAPVAGEIVATRFQFQEDERWCRARIVDTHPDSVSREYTVFFVDYGFSRTISLLDMRTIQAQFLHFPFQAIECSLDGITPISEDGWSREAKHYFKDILMENQMILAEIKDVAGTPVNVDLFASDNDKVINVAQLLIDRGWAKSYQPDQPLQTKVNLTFKPG